MPNEKLPMLPARPVDGHKGTFGTVCVVGGQCAAARVMAGGPAFTAAAALRCGAGLAVLAVPKPIMPAALIIAPGATGLALPVDERHQLRPSAVAALIDEHLDGFSCLAVGPGLGAEPPVQQIVMRLVARDDVPLVLDADAINALSVVRDFDRDLRARMVLTPHPGEFRRLARGLGLDADPVSPAEREQAAATVAQRLGCVVVLKGHRTVISDGLRTAVNDTGNVALATAGTGDVLTGMIAGFVAQFARPELGDDALALYDCCRLAVHLHGRVADRWAEAHGSAGLLATDLLALIPEALAGMPRRPNPPA